jgi:hypothetical protein
MANEYQAPRGDEFRIVCPCCKTVWTTMRLPSECPECAALVTVRAISKPTPPTTPKP